ncbi:MAG: deoxyguanosinetriphosphate triphosphohydrolase, partial [Pseudomonadota bacterium]
YAEFDGLNLTWETLEGIAKHNGPLVQREADLKTLPWALQAIPDYQALELHTHAGPEAQVAAISDDIAYINHDIDDGLRAGLFTVEDIMDVPFVGEAFADVRRRYPDISRDKLIHEAVRDMIGIMVADVLRETRQRLEKYAPESPDDIRNLSEPICDFSAAFREKERPLREFLMTRMYRHYLVNRMMGQASRVVSELFDLFISDPTILPTSQQAGTKGPHAIETARIVSDYIASMTDNFAIEEHRKLFTVSGYLAR